MVDVQQLRATKAAANETVPKGDWTGKPAIPATTVPVENTSGFKMWVEVNAGTVTEVKIDGVKIGATARVAGMFLVRPGSTISLTYSVAPTWQWFYAE